ncbi:glycosyltransferase family 2 protein [Aerococcus sanguinicola]|uniref:Glycosyltransferase family 2 protein n=1 Tax=Aerococcus sanguinicola TaxID=119206 RepID=A0A0X8FC32_9LACT|nr:MULTISPECIES: glycosyltransferase family 2 protein [Aerococcus]AMB94515.1 hypothetical protein AWM72_07015 [Aerococcus sanguinicola]MDK7049395.1 glycosyltransferase family 2 protein [Aerococcus sanguinicola]OFT95516.1 hypothetical protein HMPREF3090_04170 [Aerococcus sp. HMSC23C02]PKZ23489.1 glycosyltransferase family 2 protein [Aerococcus sanguinicola]
MLVSIIIAAYNEEKNIARMLDCIMNQSYNELEVIIIDDGSTDTTSTICKKYAEKDSRFHYHYKENGGVAAARNLGLKLMTGNLVTFLDGDDYIENNFIEKLFEPFQNEKNIDLTICSYYQNDKLIRFNECIENKEQVLLDIIRPNGSKGYLWNKLFSTQIIRERKIKFNEKIKVTSDLPFVVEYVLNCTRIQYLSKPLIHYSINDGSISNNLNNKKILTQIYSSQLCIDLLKRAKMDISIVQKYIESYFRMLTGTILKKKFKTTLDDLIYLKESLYRYEFKNIDHKITRLKFFLAKNKLNYEIKLSKLKG